MGMISFYRMIRLSIVALIATSVVVVGCGDGSKRRQPMKKDPNAQTQKPKIDPNTGKPMVDANGKPIMEPAQPEETEEQRKKKAEELAKKGDVENRIDGMIQQLMSASLVDKNNLPDGEYKLHTVATYLKYMETNNWVRAFRSQQISLDSSNVPNLSEDATEGLGFMGNNPDANRTLEIPMNFTVTKTDNQFAADRGSFSGYILLGTMVKTDLNGKVDIVNQLGNARASGSNVKPSVQELLATAGVTDGKDLKYTVNDNGAVVDLRIHKVSETRFHLAFEITEIKNDKETKIRNVVLIYDLTPAEAKTPAPADEDSALRGTDAPPPQDDGAGLPPAGPASDLPDEDQQPQQ